MKGRVVRTVVVERPPPEPDQVGGHKRHWREQRDVRPGKPASRDVRIDEWCPQAHYSNSERRSNQRAPAERTGPVLQCPFGLDHQATRAEQGVARHQSETSEDRKGCEAVERATDKVSPFDVEPLDEGA